MSSIANQVKVEGLGDLLVNKTAITDQNSEQILYTATKKCRIFIRSQGSNAGERKLAINESANSSNAVLIMRDSNSWVIGTNIIPLQNNNIYLVCSDVVAIDLDKDDYISALIVSTYGSSWYKVYELNN